MIWLDDNHLTVLDESNSTPLSTSVIDSHFSQMRLLLYSVGSISQPETMKLFNNVPNAQSFDGG